MITVEERRDLEDLITLYKLINQMKKVDNVDLVLISKGDTREIKQHIMKLRKRKCLNNVKFRHHQRNMDIGNELKEKAITAKCVCQMNESFEKYTYRGKTT